MAAPAGAKKPTDRKPKAGPKHIKIEVRGVPVTVEAKALDDGDLLYLASIDELDDAEDVQLAVQVTRRLIGGAAYRAILAKAREENGGRAPGSAAVDVLTEVLRAVEAAGQGNS